MKRNLFTLALILLFSVSLNAQTFEKGDKVINLGIGFGSSWALSTYSTAIPPISASFEYGIMDDVLDDGTIGVGGYLGFSRYKYDFPFSNYGYNYTNIVVGGRGVFHYPFVDNLDTYAGILLGFRIVSSSDFGDPGFGGTYTAASGGIAGSFFIGGRYYFSDALAAMLELGYGVSVVNLGIAFKLE